MNKDGIHANEQGAFLIVHYQVVLPQGYSIGPGVAEQRKGTGSGGERGNWDLWWPSSVATVGIV